MPNPAYSGHVEPRGAAAHRSVRHRDTVVRVTKLSVGPMDNNCYVLRDETTGRALVVDAAAEPDRILRTIGNGGADLVLTTHRHHDHWQALEAVTGATGAAVAHHRADAAGIRATADRLIEHGEHVHIGRATVEVRHTPGHTPGSICVVLAGAAADRPDIGAHVFTGDTLFPGGPGKTTTPGQFNQIMTSLTEQLFVLPDSTWVYPGHGDDTTIGAERGHLNEWRRRGW